MGDGFFFITFFTKIETPTSIANITMPLKSKEKPPPIVENPARLFKSIIVAVARISATTQGRTPPSHA